MDRSVSCSVPHLHNAARSEVEEHQKGSASCLFFVSTFPLLFRRFATMLKLNETAALSLKLAVFAAAMFLFCLKVMPPLYNLFCEITGLNGKTGAKYEVVDVEVDTSRWVTVEFVGINNDDMPWGFTPKDFSMRVHPGEAVSTVFVAKNPTRDIMVGQAVPSLSPLNASKFFHKTECFCFDQQALAPGEEAELGLQFIVDVDTPRKVNRITLSYTLFDVTERSPGVVEEKEKELKILDKALSLRD